MQQLQSLWAAFDTRRRVLAVGAAVLVFALVLGIARLASTPGMSLLYAGLEDGAAGEVIQSLEARGIAYDVRGDAIFVPSPLRDEARLMLAAKGLPANSHAGYELLESLTGFGTTSQMFDAAYWRAKEGELARTIVASPYVRTARVHISQGSSTPFRRDITPTASVTVSTSGGTLSASQARSLRFLVASAVAGMTPDDVSVIDGTGGMVYGPDTDLANAAQGSDRTTELRRNVERLLEAHVGHGRAVVELNIDTVTDHEVVQERLIDPDSRVAISSETEEDSTNSTDTRRQGVTVASNLPDGDAAEGEGSATTRELRTRQRNNFEVSETLRELERRPGAIRRMTVAVLIDGVQEPDAEGEMVWRPRDATELEALRELVASAVGIDEARGDVITIRSLPFEPVAAIGTEAAASSFNLGSLDAMTMARWAFALTALVLLALLVLRPVLATLNRREIDSARDPAALAAPDAAGLSPSEGVSVMTEQAQDPVDRLRQLIDARGEDTAHVLRHWMDDRKETS